MIDFTVLTVEKYYKGNMKQASKFTIYGDGGSRGNPGEAAYGFVIYGEDGDIIYEEGKRLGVTTNNYAEYMAVVNSLRWILEHYPNAERVHYKLDSLLIASQMAGKFKIKHPSMKELYITAKGLEAQLQAQIIYSQIPREQNKKADSLVNAALDFKI